MAPPTTKRTLFAGLYSLGLILALALAAALTWAELEASLFDVSLIAGSQALPLQCPLALSRHETSYITASFSNSSEREVRQIVRAHISDGFVTLMRQEEMLLELAPGETQRLRWPITAQDAAYGRVVLARVHALRAGPEHPYRQRSCGVLVLGVPTSGQPFVVVLTTLGLALMAFGAYGWWRLRPQQVGRWDQATLFMSLLGALAAAALASAYAGWWVVGVAALIFAALLLISIVAYKLTSR
jgi:hypothetical protein